MVTASLFFPSGSWAVSLLAMFTVLGLGPLRILWWPSILTSVSSNGIIILSDENTGKGRHP